VVEVWFVYEEFEDGCEGAWNGLCRREGEEEGERVELNHSIRFPLLGVNRDMHLVAN
jgi:hypothetical protein